MQTVAEYFAKEYPELLDALERPGAYWPNVKNNSISNDELDRAAGAFKSMGMLNSQTYQGALALMRGRLTGKVANPTTVTA